MLSAHTVKSFDEDLNQLLVLISQMGGMVEVQVAGAVDALMNQNQDQAIRIVSADPAIDKLEAEVERLAVQLIALRAPLADDLRDVVSAMKVSGILERMGDYAKNIAKRTSSISSVQNLRSMVMLPHMAQLTIGMIKDVLDAYASRNVEKAIDVWRRDKQVDDIYNALFRSLLTYMMENPQSITPSTHLLFVAKNIERIGDHATNIAEVIYFNVTGEQLGAERPKSDETPFVVQPNA
jgi:phosphate transport system protein